MTPEEKRTYNREVMRRYMQKHPEYREKQRARLFPDRLRRLYGITVEDYELILGIQDGECAICESRVSHSSAKRLSVDHNHETKEVRGLLCANCNLIIGLCKGSVEILVNAANYLSIYDDHGLIAKLEND